MSETPTKQILQRDETEYERSIVSEKDFYSISYAQKSAKFLFGEFFIPLL